MYISTFQEVCNHVHRNSKYKEPIWESVEDYLARNGKITYVPSGVHREDTQCVSWFTVKTKIENKGKNKK